MSHFNLMFLSNQQARSQGTIVFKVIPITERPVHNQTMVGHGLCLILLLYVKHRYQLTFCVSAVRPRHGRLQPPAGPGHPLRRRRHELQERRHPGDRGPDGRSVVAGQEAAQHRGLRRPHPLRQPAEKVGRHTHIYLMKVNLLLQQQKKSLDWTSGFDAGQTLRPKVFHNPFYLFLVDVFSHSDNKEPEELFIFVTSVYIIESDLSGPP